MEGDPSEATTAHVRRAALGDRESLSWLVERLSPVLVAQAAWRLGPDLRRHSDPEDLVSDAWLRLLPRLPDLPPRDGRYTPVLLRFLATAIVNRVKFLVKQQIRRRRPAPDAGEIGREAIDDPVGGPPAESTGVITAAVRGERQVQVSAALAELGPADREIVMLRGVEQWENHTVAELLHVTPQAAAMRYHRALKRLRGRIPGSVFDELVDSG